MAPQSPHCPAGAWPPCIDRSGSAYPGKGGLQACGGFGRGRTSGWLVALNGVHRGEDLRLVHGVNRIGSSYQADVALTGQGVSGLHAVLACSDTAVMLTDTGSREGVAVNGQRVAEAALSDGDELVIGSVRLMFRLAAAFAPGYRPQLRPRPAVKETPSVQLRSYLCGWLVQVQPSVWSTDYRLLNGKSSIGSSPGNSLVLAEPGVAKRHATIICAQNRCLIEATAGAHSLLVNGMPLSGQGQLRDSDQLTIGGVQFHLKWF